VKSTVYFADASIMQDLQQRIENRRGTIPTTLGILQRCRQPLCRWKTSYFELWTLCEPFL